MTLLQQLDAVFSLSNGLIFTMVCLIALVVYAHFFEKKQVAQAELAMLDDAHAMNDAYDDDNWHREEANAHYDAEDLAVMDAHCNNTVVPVVGYCLCKTDAGTFKAYKFTTTQTSAKDDKFLDMIACNHCPVCNPDMDKMLNN
jgi:hypothetical protein